MAERSFKQEVEKLKLGEGDEFRGEVGVSAWNGFAIARLCAADGAALRHDLVAVLTAVRGTSLPRLWLN